MSNNGTGVTVMVVILVAVLLCCLCLALACLGGVVYGLYSSDPVDSWSSTGDNLVTATPEVIRPAQPTQAVTGDLEIQPTSETPDLAPRPTEEGSETDETESPTPESPKDPEVIFVPTDTLETLEDTIVPVNDLLDLALRLEGKENIPVSVPPPTNDYQVGDHQTFWVTNVDLNENSEMDAVLRYVTDHAYFWIEDGVQYRESDLRDLAETFENEIYPTNREFFGSEWSPGVDGDPHLYIVFATDLGYSLAGYFSSADEYHPDAHEYSNAHETFMLNADNVGLDEEFTYGVLAHEFQHMIHWYQDRNESTWLNEGFSELAAFLNGYDAGGFDYLYTTEPDLQLNDWPNDQSSTSPHYGAAFLFVTYFLDRFGESATQALVEHPANGMASVDTVLAELGLPVGADDVFLDWAVANYLDDGSVGDGRFTYHNYDGLYNADETESISNCGPETITRDVRQYGVDYMKIDCEGTFDMLFEGSIQTGVLPENAYSGEYAVWSNKGDESNMTLTRSFDFTEQDGALTLTYWTWYDLETDYDYLYLEASTDGKHWEILTTPSGTADDPSGNSYGWGYNGLSGGDGHWIQESIDISKFAGEEVQIRFEYVTDAAVNGEGLLLDDIAVPEIGYFQDFEDGMDEWDTAGFVRIQNILPQTYRLALIAVGDETTVEYIELSEDNRAEIELSFDNGVDEYVLVVSGTTRYTRQPAAYRVEFLP